VLPSVRAGSVSVVNVRSCRLVQGSIGAAIARFSILGLDPSYPVYPARNFLAAVGSKQVRRRAGPAANLAAGYFLMCEAVHTRPRGSPRL
jgi:hypothetical protein